LNGVVMPAEMLPERRVAVTSIANRIGADAARAADVDLNGVLDARDIALFAETRGISLPARFQEIVREEKRADEAALPANMQQDR